jgi:hypothetical protein
MNLKVLTNLMSLRMYTNEMLHFKSEIDRKIFLKDLYSNFDQMMIVF